MIAGGAVDMIATGSVPACGTGITIETMRLIASGDGQVVMREEQ